MHANLFYHGVHGLITNFKFLGAGFLGWKFEDYHDSKYKSFQLVLGSKLRNPSLVMGTGLLVVIRRYDAT